MNLCPNCFRELSAAGPCPACGYNGTGAEEKHPQALRPGSILNGRYIVGRVLGQGGFGITYLALDDQTKERVAIKEYYPTELAGRTTDGHTIAVHSVERTENFSYGKERFLEEAKTLANFLGNPYVVRILSYFEENGTGYFTMEYVEGPSLDKYMAPFGGRLGVEEAKHLLLPLMDAMDEVHSKGIVHRDVAPDNIIVTRDGRVKLIDFGAARYSTGEKSKSLDVILKHGFAPYEQYMRRGRQGPWTDVYAMAATFYYAITGKVPPDATERKDEDTLIPPSTLGVPIDDKTEEALLKALEVSAADRFQRMGDFAAALRGAPVPTLEKPPVQRPAPKPAPAETVLMEEAEKKEAGKKKSRLPLILGLACAAALALVLVFARPGGKEAAPAVTPPPAAETAEPTPEPTAPPEPEPVGAEKLKQLIVDTDLVVGLRTDGSVFAVGNNDYNLLNANKWTDVKCLYRWGDVVVGLRTDGSVVAVGSNDDNWLSDNWLSLNEWTDIKQFYSFYDSAYPNDATYLVGLRNDGTVLAAGNKNRVQQMTASWTDIDNLVCCNGGIVGLRKDGTVLAAGAPFEGLDLSAFTGISTIMTYKYTGNSSARIVGLRSDGTTVAVGYNGQGQCEVSGWTDVKAIYLNDERTIGLRTDGAVYDTKGECSDWTDIEDILFGLSAIWGLRKDGSIVYVRDYRANFREEFKAVSSWTGIEQFYTFSDDFVAGLHADGTVAYAGRTRFKEVANWTNVSDFFFTFGIDYGYFYGLLSDGTVLVAGEDPYGLGNTVEGWTDIVGLWPGGSYALGLQTDGTFVAAGDIRDFFGNTYWTVDELNAAAGLNRP